MAKGFIIFLVFAAVVQASLASSSAGSSDVQTARSETVTKWWLAATEAYDTIQDPSSSLYDGGEKHLSYLIDGNNAYLEVTVPSDQLDTLKDESIALFVPLKDSVFEGIAIARKCEDWSKTEAAIDEVRKQMRDEEWVKSYYGLLGSTGSTTSAVESFGDIHNAFFRAIKDLAAYKCGIKSEIKSSCGAYPAIKVFTDVIYGPLSDGE